MLLQAKPRVEDCADQPTTGEHSQQVVEDSLDLGASREGNAPCEPANICCISPSHHRVDLSHNEGPLHALSHLVKRILRLAGAIHDL